MYGADHRFPLFRQILQQANALGSRYFVQTAGRFVQIENGRIGHQFQSDREATPFAATQLRRLIGTSMIQIQIVQYIVDDWLVQYARFQF